MEQAELARRVAFAFFALQQRVHPERVTQSELAARVGRSVGKPFTQTAAAGWLAGSVPRDLETMEALAETLGVDPGWLYFGKGEAPAGWQAPSRAANRTGSTIVERGGAKKGTRKRAG